MCIFVYLCVHLVRGGDAIIAVCSSNGASSAAAEDPSWPTTAPGGSWGSIHSLPYFTSKSSQNLRCLDVFGMVLISKSLHPSPNTSCIFHHLKIIFHHLLNKTTVSKNANSAYSDYSAPGDVDGQELPPVQLPVPHFHWHAQTEGVSHSDSKLISEISQPVYYILLQFIKIRRSKRPW